ncbi:YciI family protein [Sphingobium sufflavum]|uniref:YciI family protein n=1 Tax=Sphingobium sufflavum TaxID=1129547 RepID=UPI00227841D0|nr:YciI family protein [Sphingobium sufflavum]
MIILSSTYTAPIEQVDALRPAHIAWLKTGQAAGIFHGWGRKTPPTGGVILATGTRADVEAFAQNDPYIVGGVATVEVIEFPPAFLAPGLEALAG